MSSRLIIYMALPFLFICSCKKEKDPEEKIPVFGTCEPVSPKGNLSYNSADQTYTFKTHGGGAIAINKLNIILTHKDYPGFKLEYWGNAGSEEQPKNSANHENLNGKHIKDRVGLRRTIVFPDGAKITMVANGAAGPPISISIYDDNECHYINAGCGNTLEYSSTNNTIGRQLDEEEPDGETATFEMTETGLVYVNIYTEDQAGNKVMERVLLGRLERASPNMVNDYYDDPRMGHT